MKHIFIVNPVSGKADISGTLIPQINAAAQAANIDYTIELTKAPLHAVQLAYDYASKGDPIRLYSCGGDGTLNEVMQGAWSCPNAQVTCVPCGSGNDFVRNYGTREDFLDLAELIQGVPTTIDLMKTNLGISVAICSAGLDAQVAYGIPKFRRVPLCGGSMAYNLSILQCICSRLGNKLHITIDDEVLDQECLMVAICNGRAYGGGFMAAPEARMDDGLLDIMIVKKISRIKIASVIAAYKSGKHFAQGRVLPPFEDIVLFRRARSIRIEPMDGSPLIVNVDGECSQQSALQAEVIPAAAQIVLPRHLAAAFAK